MLNIMIVEDEPPIARSLKSMIEALNPAFCVLWLARNGRDALYQLEQVQEPVDILFTDIRMPVMDGLTLMQEVSQRYPTIALVVLSGYQDFNYVKHAMICKAIDYLLKPVSRDELSALLTLLNKKTSKQRRDELNHNIQLLLDGAPVSAIRLAHRHKEYCVLLICAGAFPSFSSDYLLPGRQLWDDINLNTLLAHSVVGQIDALAFAGRSCAEKIVVAGLEEPSSLSSATSTNMYAWTVSLFSALKETGLPITVVVSDPFSNLAQIGSIANQLRVGLSKKLVIGVSQILTLRETMSVPQARKSFLTEKEKSLKEAILAHQDNIFKALLQSLFQFFEMYRYPQILAEQVLTHLAISCCSNISTESSIPDSLSLDIQEAASNSLSYDEFYRNTLFLFEEYIRVPPVEGRTILDKKPSKLLTDIEAYLQEHYAENITNTQLSRQFGLVPSYLSKLFKTYMGVTPSKYLTSLRIEQAKRLIEASPRRLSKEIASAVGFSDSLYFSRVFKKETNYSPAEYKRICEQQQV